VMTYDIMKLSGFFVLQRMYERGLGLYEGLRGTSHFSLPSEFSTPQNLGVIRAHITPHHRHDYAVQTLTAAIL
jgi:hypothetical protein